MCDIIKKPSECSKEEKKDFYKLVLKSNQVETTGLERRIERAKLLAFHYEGPTLAGVAALKCPNEDYKRGIFREAGIYNESDKYNLELGWVYTEFGYREKGIGSGLIQKILYAERSQNIYATTGKDNNKMQRILILHGFKNIGKSYTGSKNENVLLFTRSIS